MPFWPAVVQAAPETATSLLQSAARNLLHPLPLGALALATWWILQLARLLWSGDGPRRAAAAALTSTLAVDGAFFLAALLAPQLSGLI